MGHCERSEAIQRSARATLNCFTAALFAPTALAVYRQSRRGCNLYCGGCEPHVVLLIEALVLDLSKIVSQPTSRLILPLLESVARGVASTPA